MTNQELTICTDVEACIDQVIDRVGKEIVFGMPLGLGKPPHLINALYRRAKQDPSINLKIITAISLERPCPQSDLEARFLGPFLDRVFDDVPALDYATDQRQNCLPANVSVSEFYFKPASFLGHKTAQRNYICSNYTHASRDLVDFGVNVVAQSIAKQERDGVTRYSLSCNSDIFLDLVPMLEKEKRQGREILILGQVNEQMPFMPNDAETDGHQFDFVVDNSAYDHHLFSTPNLSIAPTDHMIGFNASTLLKDGGTLQIGIGSLGDALINSTLMRHQRNDDYCEMLDDLKLRDKFSVIDQTGDHGRFEKGLYGNTEMFVHGYMNLYKAGILKRKVYDNLAIQQLVNEGLLNGQITPEAIRELLRRKAISQVLTERDVTMLKRFGIFREEVEWKQGELCIGDIQLIADLTSDHNFDQVISHCLGDKLKGGVVLHGAFYLGPRDFYQDLRDLSDEQKREINMTAVSYTNGLYGEMELKNAQRQDARYINTCMKMSLMGAAASDALENGQVVSGVGGQYNFVAMAHEQPGARSILLMKSTRNSKKGLESNIVFNYGYTTIPRHLRDIVITEYGIADLRGKSDNQVMQQLIQVADSRFQDQLVAQAKASGKLQEDYQVPEAYRNNTPAYLAAILNKYQQRGCFEPFPFGCDFTAEELQLGKALKSLKAKQGSKLAIIKTLLRGWMISDVPEEIRPLLARMKLERPGNFKEKVLQRLLVGELNGHHGKNAVKPASLAQS